MPASAFSSDLLPRHDATKPVRVKLHNAFNEVLRGVLLDNQAYASELDPVIRSLALSLSAAAWDPDAERSVALEFLIEAIPTAQGEIELVLSRVIDEGEPVPVLRINSQGQPVGLRVAGAFSTVPVTLSDAATIETDASLSNSFRVKLGGDRLLQNPTNMVDGQVIVWEIFQDGTGNRHLTYGSKFRFTVDIPSITLTVIPDWFDILTCKYNEALDCLIVAAFNGGIAPQPASITKAYNESLSIVDVTLLSVGIDTGEALSAMSDSFAVGAGYGEAEALSVSDSISVKLGTLIREALVLDDELELFLAAAIPPATGDALSMSDGFFALKDNQYELDFTDAIEVMGELVEWLITPTAVELADSFAASDSWAVRIGIPLGDSNSAFSDSISSYKSEGTVDLYDTPGTYQWECPEGVTQVKVESWGGGAAGDHGYEGVMCGEGGGGGAYSRTNSKSVTPGNFYTVVVGAGGVDNARQGGESSFDNGTKAKGSIGSQGGQASQGTGDVKYSGGQAGGIYYGSNGAGGGGGAGASGNGNSSVDQYGAAANGEGGAGGDGATPTTAAVDGAPFGGGGGGGGKVAGLLLGGVGGDGAVKLTYVPA